MTDTPLTDAQEAALAQLREAAPDPVVLHLPTGDALVRKAYAAKLPTSGHGRLKAAYRLAEGV